MSVLSLAKSLVGEIRARVRGLTVVIVVTVVAFVWFASLALPTWQKIVGYAVLGLCLLLVNLKLSIGGDEGPIGLEITDGQRRIVMSNIPPWAAHAMLPSGLRNWMRRPLPQHAGLIEGSAGDQASLKKGADVPESLEIPPDAASLQPSAADTASVGLTEGKPKIEKIDR